MKCSDSPRLNITQSNTPKYGFSWQKKENAISSCLLFFIFFIFFCFHSLKLWMSIFGDNHRKFLLNFVSVGYHFLVYSTLKSPQSPAPKKETPFLSIRIVQLKNAVEWILQRFMVTIKAVKRMTSGFWTTLGIKLIIIIIILHNSLTSDF